MCESCGFVDVLNEFADAGLVELGSRAGYVEAHVEHPAFVGERLARLAERRARTDLAGRMPPRRSPRAASCGVRLDDPGRILMRLRKNTGVDAAQAALDQEIAELEQHAEQLAAAHGRRPSLAGDPEAFARNEAEIARLSAEVERRRLLVARREEELEEARRQAAHAEWEAMRTRNARPRPTRLPSVVRMIVYGGVSNTVLEDAFLALSDQERQEVLRTAEASLGAVEASIHDRYRHKLSAFPPDSVQANADVERAFGLIRGRLEQLRELEVDPVPA
jgi:hypothetical protein